MYTLDFGFVGGGHVDPSTYEYEKHRFDPKAKVKAASPGASSSTM